MTIEIMDQSNIADYLKKGNCSGGKRHSETIISERVAGTTGGVVSQFIVTFVILH